jgi:hypothetical protein
MTTATAHLRADELLRLIDNDTTPLERSQFDSHLLACARCSEEAATMREDASLFAATVRTAAWEDELPAARVSFAEIVAARDARAAAGVVPLRRGWAGVPAWARAAAVLLIVAGPVAAVPAWREWLVQKLTGGAGVQTEFVREQQPAVEALSSRVVFEPESPAFVVQLDAAQSAGELRIRPAASGREGSLAMENAATEEPIYSANTLRIRNSAASAATYVVELPESVRTVTVRIGEADVRTVTAAEIGSGVVISLQR